MKEERPQTPQEERDFFDQLKLAGIVAAAIALIVFFLQNLDEVEIQFLWFEWTTSMIWALIVTAVLGAVGGMLSVMVAQRRSRRRKPEQES